MTETRSLKKRLAVGERLNGCFISLFSPIAAEIIAATGYDIALIDMEHGPGGHMDAIAMMQAVRMRNCQPVIRTVSSSATDIKRTLDTGPSGIMVPDIRSATHARKVVAHCRYAPSGDRGAAPGFIRGSGFGGDVGAYLSWMAQDFLLILQIESREALDNLEEIIAVDGVDMVFIGPADLSASLGSLGGFNNEQFRHAFATIEDTVKDAALAIGSITFADWSAERLFANGHQLVISNSDALLLAKAAKHDLETLKNAATSHRTAE